MSVDGARRFRLVVIVVPIVLAVGVAWFWRRDRSPALGIRNVVLISIDIVPTVCSLLDVDRPPVLHGEDLSPALQGETLPFPPRFLYCESFAATRYNANPLLGLVNQQWKYIQTPRPELYELPLDPRESENLADRSDPLVLDALAAAYAAAGRFEEAVKTEQAAISLASATQTERVVDNFRQRLQLYRQARPYRDPLLQRGATPF